MIWLSICTLKAAGRGLKEDLSGHQCINTNGYGRLFWLRIMFLTETISDPEKCGWEATMVSRYQRLPSAFRAVLPWFIICICFVVLAGCIWIPTFEHRTDTSQPDFRNMVGEENSKRLIRTGAIQQKQVFALLGPPQMASVAGRAIAYVMYTKKGIWVSPLCFRAWPAEQHVYVLRLIFNDHDTLIKWDLAHDEEQGYQIPLLGEISPQVEDVIARLNKDGPELLPVPVPFPSTQPTTRGLF
jgi:hypothetical protein